MEGRQRDKDRTGRVNKRKEGREAWGGNEDVTTRLLDKICDVELSLCVCAGRRGRLRCQVCAQKDCNYRKSLFMKTDNRNNSPE